MAGEHPQNDKSSSDVVETKHPGSLVLRGIKQAFEGLLGRNDQSVQEGSTTTIDEATAEEAVNLSPRSILEAMLFVGNDNNEPLAASQAAELMRGVDIQEIDQLVNELNASYEREDCPYRIVSVGAGYRLQLRDEFDRLRDRFYGRIRRIRLSQAAIDVLAIIAYHQPTSRAEVERLRGKPSGVLLAQLVRRDLLEVEQVPRSAGGKIYRTTTRFLRLFKLESLEELPRSDEFEKTL